MSLRESVERSVRSRALASDGRAGAHPRDLAWRLQRDFVVERWRLLLVAWWALLSPVLLVWWFVPPFVQGMALGGAGVGAASALWALVVSSTGTAPKAMGSQAEQWTAQELRQLRQNGWELVNHFTLSVQGDIDHLLVGPAGVLVIETKWSATPWFAPGMAERIKQAQVQAEARARQVCWWGPVKASHLPVHTVVVLWGGGARRSTPADLDALADVSVVVPGPELRRWVRGLAPVPSLEPGVVDTLWREVRHQAQRRDDWEQRHRPAATTPQQWVWRIAAWLVTTSVVGLGFVQAVSSVGIAWSVGGGLVVAALGTLGVRLVPPRSVLRGVAAGVATGAAAGLVLLAVLAAAFALA